MAFVGGYTVACRRVAIRAQPCPFAKPWGLVGEVQESRSMAMPSSNPLMRFSMSPWRA